MFAIQPKWVIPVVPRDVCYSGCDVVVSESGKIVSLVPDSEIESLYPHIQKIPLPNCVLLPGFIDSHCHVPMLPLRGLADDLPLKKWLFNYMLPIEDKVTNENFISDSSRVSLAEQIRCGTTTTTCFYFHTDQLIRIVDEYQGPRVVTGPTLLKDKLTLEMAEADLPKFRNHPLIIPAVMTHSAYLCTDQNLMDAKMLSERDGIAQFIHLHETEEDNNIHRLKQQGLLHKRMIAAHCVHVTDSDLQDLADAGVSVSHCPDSNCFLASGFAGIKRMEEKGINVALGTDAPGANRNLSMMTTMRSAVHISKALTRDASSMTSHDAIYYATMAGAKAIGIEKDLGSIEVGKMADLVAIDLSAISCQPVYNPASSVVYSDGARVHSVWVGGKRLVNEEKLLFVSEETLQQHLDNCVSRIEKAADFDVYSKVSKFAGASVEP